MFFLKKKRFWKGGRNSDRILAEFRKITVVFEKYFTSCPIRK